MMLPILIIQFYPSEGPGYLAQFLDAEHLPWHLLRLDADEPLPTQLDGYSGLVMMGGPMSANDNLPWTAPLLALIRLAQAEHKPVLGHCLGGQLIAKALGGEVSANAVREIGWGKVTPSDNNSAQAYFGNQPFSAFHWHGETFSLPEGATHLLSSAYCPNQAFSLGYTLALQCHIEMTSDMVREWCIADADYHAQGLASSPAVEPISVMQHQLDEKISHIQTVANHCYSYWLRGLQR